MDYPGVRYEPRRKVNQFRAYDEDGDARGPWVATEAEALGWLRRTTGGGAMSHEDVKATQYTCDGCGSVHLILSGEEMPYGYHGRHMQIGDFGGTGGEWFACRRRCILKAIDASEENNR